jgi:diguanylate cyclase (GGDEF)-like protein
MTRTLAYFIFVLNVCFSCVVFAQTSDVLHASAYNKAPVLIDVDAEDSINLGSKLEYFEDSENKLSLADIRRLEKHAWMRSDTDTPNFGYTDSSYWFRFRLNNRVRCCGGLTENKIIAIKYALLDHVEYYEIQDGDIMRSHVTGDIYPFSQRPLRHRDFLFPISLKFNEPVDIYFRVSTQGSTQFPISIWDAQQFSFADQDEQIVKALYYGMILALVLYNFFLFVSIKERPYIYYVGLMLSMLMLMSGSHGFLLQYIFPESPVFHKMTILISVPSVMLFASLFSSYFLHLGKIAPRLNVLMNIFAVIFLACIAGTFILPYDISTRISVFLAIPVSFVIMFTGPYAWSKGQAAARYFTMAWVFLMLGLIISALSKFGVLPRNAFTENAANWGSAIESVLLSFALADRFNKERYAKFKAQRKQLKESEQRKTAETKLYYQATHQSVDGFPNIVMLQQLLHSLLHSESQSLRHFSLVFMHLSRIQEINKTLGHANADIVLGLFSRRLSNLKMDDTVSLMIEQIDQTTHYFAHIEGVIFAHILKSGELNSALQAVAKIRAELAEPIEFNGMELDLGLSIGIASYPTHGTDIETIIRHARVAIDGASNLNDQIGVYSHEVNPYSARRLVLMGELKKAIETNALALHYQPIICCETGDMFGAEALLRWHHPTLGFVPPDEFVLVAEKTGIIRPLTYWVLDNALAAYASWPQAGERKTISVNISAVNLHEKDFDSNLSALLKKHDVRPEDLVLELTETSVMTDPENAMSVLKKLANDGVKIGIDDFGTGHSSMSYIQQLPVYEIKIDRSFVMEMDQVSGDEVIVRTTLNLSHDLGYKVVAEGIENQNVLDKLGIMGCDLAQGYHIARPMPLEALIEWIEARCLSENSDPRAAKR